MCTAVSFLTKDHYFGRNLDLYYHYHEQVTVTPRNFPFTFRFTEAQSSHYAMIGMATIVDDYPLYYEATNEKGLSIAGLNFPGNAVYGDYTEDKINLATFELIPYLLGKCETVQEVRVLLPQIQLTRTPYSSALPPTPLHWLISDAKESITLEPLAKGLTLYENPVGVLTNNPPFHYHMYRLSDFMGLSKHPPVNQFADTVALEPYCLGMGALGLPGDPSSASRFVRAAFTKINSHCRDGEESSVTQFFHILQAVEQQKGLVKVEDGHYEYTLYSSCCNTNKGIYYYRTYENSQITAVDMHKTDLNASNVISFSLVQGQQIHWRN